jgi:hypothetical protein
MRWIAPLLLAIGLLLTAPRASACPDCETALLTRRRFATDDVTWRLGVAVLPLAMSVGVAFVLGRALDRRSA